MTTSRPNDMVATVQTDHHVLVVAMKFRPAEDVVFRDVAGEAVLLNLSTGTYFGLDTVGTRIWHLIADHGTTEKIIESLLAEYDVDAEQARRDLEKLTRQLLDKGLLRTDAGEASSAR